LLSYFLVRKHNEVGARAKGGNEMQGRTLLALALGTGLATTWVTVDTAWAQQPPAPPYKVTPLASAPLTGDPNKETVMIRIDWPPNVSTPWHTHPGDEYATVLEGSLITQRDGEEPKTLAAGQSYHQPAGTVHVAKTGGQPATTINVFVVEKGKPFLAPANK
jgi:quercetin dioxygenase-like cupin family protein